MKTSREERTSMSQLQDQVKTGSALDSNQAVGHAATVTGKPDFTGV